MTAGTALRWKKASKANEAAIRAFLYEREPLCVAAAARFKELAACSFVADTPGTAWAGFDADGAVRSFALATKSGLVSVVFSDAADPANRKTLSRIFAARRVSSVQGLREDVELAERVLERTLRTFARRYEVDPVDYSLMNLDGAPSEQALSAGPTGISVRQAFPPDAELLFPLQAAYELEEVVPAGGVFNPAAARLSFERALVERTILYAVADGRAVGKAGTNARSFRLDQIGGVYVLPEYRGRGIARRLVAELALLLADRGRGAALFVKKRNERARRAYQSVGFVPGADYRITYYTEKRT